MKYIFAFFILFLGFPVSAQTGVNYSDAELIKADDSKLNGLQRRKKRMLIDQSKSKEVKVDKSKKGKKSKK